MTPAQPIRVRLGLFELDVKTGELSSLESGEGGRRLFLQEQPLRVLRILIECGGEMATRDEIKKKLWPNDTIVDFDHSINVAIGTLRRALGDSATEPKYIETIPRRGYRLMVLPQWAEVIDEQSMIGPPETSGGAGPNPESSGASLIGKKVSHFRVLEVIGGGGMGMVFKAEDLKLGRRVAMKFLPEEMASDPLSLKRFEREARTASSLNHANICTIFGIEEYEGQPIIVMELLDGETLRDRLAKSGSKPLPLDQTLEIAFQTCDGLQAAHAKGIIHRDIKPANIFLSRDGPAKILDFGLAKLIEAEELGVTGVTAEGQSLLLTTTPEPSAREDTNLTRTGSSMGTASYMSPEQIRKETLDARTDLFSFGLVLYEMATGQRAFSGDDVSGVQHAIVHQPAFPVRYLNASIPPALEAVIAGTLQKDRVKRYQSAAQLRAELLQVPSPARLQARRIRNWLAVAALAIIVSIGSFSGYRYIKRYQLSAADTIVIADLKNQTSDAVLDEALNLALPVELAQTPVLQVLAQDKVRETMVQLNHPQDARVTPEIARDVCLKTNSRAVVTSSIADVGNHFHIELAGINCQSGKTFARSEQDATLRTGIVHSLGIAGVQLRQRMGEPNESIKKFNQPLELATSASLDALQLVAKAFKQHTSRDFAGTISLYERAIDIDPSFALAYASVGTQYFMSGEISKAIANEQKAFDLRDRLTGQLKYLAETLYYGVGQGDLRTALPVYQEWVHTFPLDGVAHINFASNLYYLGKYDESAAEAREALRLMPQLVGPGAYFDLMSAETYGNRLEQAKATFATIKARKGDDRTTHLLRHLIAFVQHDDAGMRQELGWLRNNNAMVALAAEARVDLYSGRFHEGNRLLKEAKGLATNTRNAVDFRVFQSGMALQNANVEDWTAAQRLMKESGPSDGSRTVQLLVALTLAESGDLEHADQLVRTMDEQAPHDTLMQFYYLPTIRAAIEIHRHNAAEAIKVLQPAEQYELTVGDYFNSMFPAYMRGRAYLQLGQGKAASAEFQKLLDHPTVVGRYVTGALAHLQLGRAQTMVGDKVAARRSYENFLTLWKDADSDVPIYKQAKAEYAQLK